MTNVIDIFRSKRSSRSNLTESTPKEKDYTDMDDLFPGRGQHTDDTEKRREKRKKDNEQILRAYRMKSGTGSQAKPGTSGSRTPSGKGSA